MKILILMTQFHQLNGAERLGVELAESLNAREGLEADLASIYCGDMPEVLGAEEVLRSRGIHGFHYLGLQVHSRPFPFLRAIFRLRALLRTEDYDVVETSQITPAIMACWAALGLRTRHVEGIHDVFIRDRYNSVRHKIWRISIKLGHCARFYAISEYARDKWIAYSKTKSTKTDIVLNGIPDDCFDAVPDREGVRRELGLPGGARIALFVGRMLKRKGIDTVLAALGPVLESRNLHLVYIGEWGYASEGFFPEEDRLRAMMESQIAEEGWGPRVHFLGRRADVPRLMASCDVLVHPARIEGFGLVLAEALAAGLPVVASNVEGIPEVLSGSGSTMTDPEDIEAFRAAVLAVLDRNSEKASAVATTGRARAEEFRMEKRVGRLIRHFENACGK